MVAMNETRTTVEVASCPACGRPIQMVLRVELGEARIEPPMPGGRVTVSFEFGQPMVTGAVVKPHDCMTVSTR